MTSFPWPFSLIQEWLEHLEEAIFTAPQDAIDWLWQQLNPRLHDIQKLTTTSRDFIVTTTSARFDEVDYQLQTITTYMPAAVTTIQQHVDEELEKAIERMGIRFDTAFDGALAPIPSAIADIPKNLSKALFEGLTSFAEGIQRLVAPETLHGIYTGISHAMDWLMDMVVDSITKVAGLLPKPGHTPAEEVVERAWSIVKALAGIVLPFGVAAVAGELVHPLKQMGFPQLAAIAFEIGGFKRIVSDIMGTFVYVSTLLPLRYALYEIYTPLVPREEEILRLTERGVLNEADFKEVLRKAGFSGYWADLFWRTHWQPPDEDDLTRMLWRGVINEETFNYWLKYAGYAEDIIAGYREIAKRIPGAADLIRFVVREVITPDDFRTYMAKQGFEEFWADAYWEAHWVLPPPERLWHAFLRGVISEEEYKKYIVWHDYKPDPRPGIRVSDVDIMYATQYDLPGRIDIRWMWRWGIVTPEEYKQLLRLTGLSPEWLDKVAEAEMRNVLVEERTRLATALETLYAHGKISEEEFRKRLKNLWFNPDEIELRVEKAKAVALARAAETTADITERLTADERRRLATLLEKLLLAEVISEDEFKTRAAQLGLAPAEIDLRLEIVAETKRLQQARLKPSEPKPITEANLTTAWEFGLISFEQLVKGLEYLGYNPEDAKLVAMARTRAALRNEIGYLITNAKADFVKGYINQATLRANLAQLGLPPELIEYHVADAIQDRDRKRRDDILRILETAYVKGKIDDDTFKREMAKVLVDAEALEIRYALAALKKRHEVTD